MEAYVINAYISEYRDYHSEIVGVYSTKETAEHTMSALEKELTQEFLENSRVIWIGYVIEEFDMNKDSSLISSKVSGRLLQER